MTVPQRIPVPARCTPSTWSIRPIGTDTPSELVVGAEFTARRLEPDLVWVEVRGEIDIRNARALYSFTHRQLDGARRVALDLAAVEFFGAVGLAVLDDLDERVRDLNARWAFLSGRPVQRLLRVADAAVAARSYKTREGVLAALSLP